MNATTAGLAYSSTYRVEGRRLAFTRELRSTAREVPASGFGEYARFISAVDADAGQRVKITGAPRPAPAVASDATATDVYQAGLSAYNARQYDAALALWKRSAELDPKMGDGWVAVGLAYIELGKYADAASAIQKQIDLDPVNKRAYSDLGYALKSSRKLDEAAKAYAKHVEINPVDGNAWRNLGEIYLDLQRYADAVAALEKASSLVDRDGWMLTRLGEAYLRVHQPDKARAAFDRALDAEQSPRVWTKIAWTLSDEGIDLDRVADLALRTIRRVSEQTGSLTMATVTSSHLDLTERLAWAWDALGWARYQQGRLADAERYLRASWALASFPVTATHITKVFAKRYSGAPAGTARPVASHDPAKIAGAGATGRAGFVAIVGSDQRVLDTRFAGGSEALRTLEPELRKLLFQEKFPDDTPLRVTLGIQVNCSSGNDCVATMGFRPQMTLPPAQEKK